MAERAFRTCRPVDPEARYASMVMTNLAALPTGAAVGPERKRVDAGGRPVTVLARWAAAATICPFATPSDPRASWCGGAACGAWVAYDDDYGTCGRVRQ